VEKTPLVSIINPPQRGIGGAGPGGNQYRAKSIAFDEKYYHMVKHLSSPFLAKTAKNRNPWAAWRKTLAAAHGNFLCLPNSSAI
jgi:hypothetical protein